MRPLFYFLGIKKRYPVLAHCNPTAVGIVGEFREEAAKPALQLRHLASGPPQQRGREGGYCKEGNGRGQSKGAILPPANKRSILFFPRTQTWEAEGTRTYLAKCWHNPR